jgi:hypothetical protein
MILEEDSCVGCIIGAIINKNKALYPKTVSTWKSQEDEKRQRLELVAWVRDKRLAPSRLTVSRYNWCSSLRRAHK